MSSFRPRGLSQLAETLRRAGTPGRGNSPLAAAFWMTLAVAALSGLSGFGKYLLNQGIEPLMIVFFRNFFCVVWMLPLLAWRGVGLARTSQLRLYGVRIMFTLLSMWFWFAALAMIPLAQVQATSFLSPLFATMFAIVWLGERVSLARWLALVVGLIGALVILRPFGASIGMGQLYAVAAAVAIGIVGPLVKQLTVTEDSDKIVFITNLILVPASAVPAIFVWQWPAASLWPLLFAMGACACLGHVFMVRAFNAGDASLVATFDFSRLPFAVLIGIVFFGEPTDIWTWIGAVVIFCAAFFVTRKETSGQSRQFWRREVTDPIGLTPVRLKL